MAYPRGCDRRHHGTGGRAKTFGSLLLGAYDEHGRLVYIGRVGSGFSESELRDLSSRLDKLTTAISPFATPVPRDHARSAQWVRTELASCDRFMIGVAGCRLPRRRTIRRSISAYTRVTTWSAGTSSVSGASSPPTFTRSHDITADTFARAQELDSYFLVHALVAFDHMGKDEVHDDARALLVWIAAEHLARFNRRDAHRANRNRFRTAGEIDPALHLLEELGHIRTVPPPERPGPGRKPSPAYLVHPIHHASNPGQNGQNP